MAIQDFILRFSVGVATLCSGAAAWAQEALPRALTPTSGMDPKSLFEKFQALEKSGATPAEMHRLMMDTVPGSLDQVSATAHHLDLAQAAHSVLSHETPWQAIAVVTGVLALALGAAIALTRQGHIVRSTNRLLAGDPQLPKETVALLREACQEEFTLRHIAGLPVYRPNAAVSRARAETRGRVIVALPDFALPSDFLELHRTLANDFHGWDVEIIGSPYDPLLTRKGGLTRAKVHQRWASGASLEAHRELMRQKGELYPGTPLVLIGIRDGIRHTLRAVANLNAPERAAVRQVVPLAPSIELHPLEKRSWWGRHIGLAWQALWGKKTGPFRQPAWVELARSRDHKRFEKELRKGDFDRLGVRITPVLTINERQSAWATQMLRGMGIGKTPPPVMAQPDQWEAAREVVTRIREGGRYREDQRLAAG